MKTKCLITLGIVLFLGLLSFILLDIALGEPMWLECRVTGKHYKPPETTVSIDADGGLSVVTDPEEYHVTVWAVDWGRDYDLKASPHVFSALTNNQIVSVRARLGRWSQAIHIGDIEP